MKTKKKAQKHYNSEESLETRHSSVGDGVKSEAKKTIDDLAGEFWKNLLGGSVKDTTEQLTSTTITVGGKKSGELKMGEEISLKKQQEKQQAKMQQEAEEKAEADMFKRELHREYYRENVESVEVKAAQKEYSAMNQQIEDIRAEIVQLIKSSKQMEAAFKDVAVQVNSPAVQKPSTYHLHFFDWILVTMKNVRARMEEGVSWAQTLSNKRAEKKYWNMAKKHGTTFSLSQERSTATQTG